MNSLARHCQNLSPWCSQHKASCKSRPPAIQFSACGGKGPACLGWVVDQAPTAFKIVQTAV